MLSILCTLVLALQGCECNSSLTEMVVVWDEYFPDCDISSCNYTICTLSAYSETSINCQVTLLQGIMQVFVGGLGSNTVNYLYSALLPAPNVKSVYGSYDGSTTGAAPFVIVWCVEIVQCLTISFHLSSSTCLGLYCVAYSWLFRWRKRQSVWFQIWRSHGRG